MLPVPTPRCALCPPALPGSAPAMSCPPARAQATDPEPATPYPCRVGGWGLHTARKCTTCCGGACVRLWRPNNYSGWRVATVADGHVGAAGGGGGRI
eukprot:scaffold27703_cov115-Isochrysis_galbana.AAC.2